MKHTMISNSVRLFVAYIWSQDNISSMLRNSDRQARKKRVDFSQPNAGEGETDGKNYNSSCYRSLGSIRSSIFFSVKPRYEYFAFFRWWPPVRFYFKVLRAIEKLQIEHLTVENPQQSMDARGEATLTKKDEGFKEFVTLLRKALNLPKEWEIEDFKLWKLSTSSIPNTHLECLNATINGKDKYLVGPSDARRQLKEMADVFVRSRITTGIVIWLKKKR